MNAGLSPKQKMFVAEWIVDFNGTQAAIRAGYSEKTACEQASRLLANAKIQQAIKEEMKKREQRTQITQDRVIQALAEIAFADVTDVVTVQDGEVLYCDTSRLSKNQRAAIAGIKKGVAGIEVRFHDKTKALELLGKHLGLWEQRRAEDESGVRVVMAEGIADWSE